MANANAVLPIPDVLPGSAKRAGKKAGKTNIGNDCIICTISMDHERPGLGLGGGRPRQSIMRHEEEEGKEGKEAARSDEDQQQQLEQLRDWLARTNGNPSSSSNESEWVQQWAVAGRAIPGEAPRKAGRKRKQRG